jgi:hypothetical protein
MDYKIEIEEIADYELQALQLLDFRVHRPTCKEIYELLLFCADPSFDFIEVQNKMESLVNFCLLDKDIMLRFDNFCIGVSCLYIALE